MDTVYRFSVGKTQHLNSGFYPRPIFGRYIGVHVSRRTFSRAQNEYWIKSTKVVVLRYSRNPILVLKFNEYRNIKIRIETGIFTRCPALDSIKRRRKMVKTNKVFVLLVVIVIGLVGCKAVDSTLEKSSAKAITSFSFPSLSCTGSITDSAKTIAVTVPYGTSVTALAPAISHTGTSVSPASGVAGNFTNPSPIRLLQRMNRSKRMSSRLR